MLSYLRMNQFIAIIDIHPVMEHIASILDGDLYCRSLFPTDQDRINLYEQIFDKAIRILIFLDDDQPRATKVDVVYRRYLEKPVYRFLRQSFTAVELATLRQQTHMKTHILNHQLKVFSWQ